jgi:DNA-binding transcriptional ArsR family regulator
MSARVSVDYFLATSRLIGDLVPGDALTALVFLTIVSRMFKVRGTKTAAGRRGSVTVYAVAKDLGLSYETVRRHVKRLVEAKLCERDLQGLRVPAHVFARNDFQRAMSRNHENLQDLDRRLP